MVEVVFTREDRGGSAQDEEAVFIRDSLTNEEYAFRRCTITTTYSIAERRHIAGIVARGCDEWVQQLLR